METGQSGVFPVTALMTRQALDVIHLTLENADGETTRMRVTSEHPLFTVGLGWASAGDLVPGDVVRDSALQALRVLSVELDSAPTRVHNLEVAGAHTYFAGELEAWGHNADFVRKFAAKRVRCGSRKEAEQPDPLGFAAGDLNLYAYTWNDPANWTDPSGLVAVPEWVSNTAKQVGTAVTLTAQIAGGALRLGNMVATAQTAITDIVET